jgi:hypothetical protein
MMPLFSPAHVLRRRTGAIVAAIIAMSVFVTSAASAQQRRIPVMIQTVPELPGVEFSLDGKSFKADENGLVLAVVPKPGIYELSVESKILSRGGNRSEFSLWSDGSRQITRSIEVRSFTYLQAGFANTRSVSFSFVTDEGTAIGPDAIDSIHVISPAGGEEQLSGPGPHALVATSPETNGKNLALERTTYRIEDVIINGTDVLDAGVTVNPAESDALRIELPLSSVPGAAGAPAAQQPGASGTDLVLPPGLWIALLSIAAGAVLLIVASRLHVVAVTKSAVSRVRSWSPASRLRRLNPIPRVTAGVRRLNPKPVARYLRQLNPTPRLAFGIRKFREQRKTRARQARRRIREAGRPQVSVKAAPEPKARKKPRPKLTRTPPPKAEKRSRRKERTPRQPDVKASLTKNRSLNPARALTDAMRKRRLRAQLNALRWSGPGSRGGNREARKGLFPDSKKPREIALLWLRGSQSKGSMRRYYRGSRVRIKLRNGHLVIGTIGRTPSHVDHDALNVFVDGVYDEFGNELLNSPEDSFILPSQIARIDNYEEEEHRVVRLAEPEDESGDRPGRSSGNGDRMADRR